MRNCTTPWLLLAGLTLGGAAYAGEPVTAPASNDATYSAGIQAAIDPATGQLRQPTAAESRALKLQAGRMRIGTSSKAPRNEAEAMKTQRALRNGGYSVKVPEDRMSAMVATVQPDGSIKISHADENGNATATAQEDIK